MNKIEKKFKIIREMIKKTDPNTYFIKKESVKTAYSRQVNL